MSQGTKVCQYCGKEFIPTGKRASRRKYCQSPHFKNCEYCGKEFEITDISNFIPKTCSTECSNKLKMKNCRDVVKSKYGVDNISQSIEFKDKIREGINSSQDVAVRRRKETMLSKYGADSPMKISEFREKIFETNKQRYGHKNPARSDEIRQKISEIVSSEEFQKQYADTCLKH